DLNFTIPRLRLLLLQWGRCANAAETARPAMPGSSARASFNGAAARTQRRRSAETQTAEVNVASMGPLRERSGDPPGRLGCVGSRRCFNGAAARTQRRLLRRAHDERAAAPASMGPLRERSGDFVKLMSARRNLGL